MSKKQTTKSEKSTPTELFADINVSMKTGHLVKDAELLSEGKFVKIRIACNKQYETPQGEQKTTTNYFNALVSGNLKEAFDTSKGLKKGDWIYLKGEESTKSFDTPEGYKKTESTIFAYKVTLKKKKADSATTTQASASKTPAPALA